MTKRWTCLLVLLSLAPGPAFGQTAGMLGFQGLIKDAGGVPISGSVDLTFNIYDAEAGGNLEAGPFGPTTVTATNGVVSTKFGPVAASAFDGGDRWLEVSIDDGGGPVALSRIEMATAPAVSEQVNRPGSGTPAIEVDAAGNVTILGTTQVGSTITIDGVANTVSSNGDLELHVSSGRALRLETNGTSPNIISGHPGNSVGAGVFGGTVAGGGNAPFPNSVTANLATVSGGDNNTAGGGNSTVGGGGGNTASGGWSTIGGGFDNSAAGALDSTVGGGSFNTAGGTSSTVGGGDNNTASGLQSTVPGGTNNTAGGDFSFAAGRRAKVRDAAQVGGGDPDGDEGSFVWADSSDFDFPSATEANISPGPNQFLVRTTGGAVFVTAIDGVTGDSTQTVELTTSGGIVASGTITSGSSITINGTAGSETISSTDDLEFHVSSGRALRLETNGTSPNIIGGHPANSAGPSVIGGTIAGGGSAASPNSVTLDFATVGGGLANTANQGRATVGGGQSNTASGTLSTVAGGNSNTASGLEATVGGGHSNTAGGMDSTVPGGSYNTADGNYSFAAGRNAQADNNGMFVWADDGFSGFPYVGETNFTPAANQFLARATGGVVFVSAVASSGNSTAGVQLAAGGGSWSSLSDRNAKANVKPVDGREVLEKLARVSVATWNYRAQDESIRHIGPMAQDFHAAFAVGEDQKFITTIDADGVALAAIQGLHEIVKEQEARIGALERALAQTSPSDLASMFAVATPAIAPLCLIGFLGMARRRKGDAR